MRLGVTRPAQRAYKELCESLCCAKHAEPRCKQDGWCGVASGADKQWRRQRRRAYLGQTEVGAGGPHSGHLSEPCTRPLRRSGTRRRGGGRPGCRRRGTGSSRFEMFQACAQVRLRAPEGCRNFAAVPEVTQSRACETLSTNVVIAERLKVTRTRAQAADVRGMQLGRASVRRCPCLAGHAHPATLAAQGSTNS